MSQYQTSLMLVTSGLIALKSLPINTVKANQFNIIIVKINLIIFYRCAIKGPYNKGNYTQKKQKLSFESEMSAKLR
jgi:hypothetical protein